MSNEQIINTLSESNNTCGRLEEWQLRSINLKLNEKPAPFINWKGIGIAASLLFALPAAYAQHRAAKLKPAYHQQLPKKITYKTISGTVIDSADKMPLPGVIVLVKGTAIHAVTNTNGNYTINVPDNTETLAVSFTGYTPQDINLLHDSQCVDVTLADASRVKIIGYGVRTVRTITGGAISIITVKKAPFYKRWYYKLIKQPVKKIFG